MLSFALLHNNHRAKKDKISYFNSSGEIGKIVENISGTISVTIEQYRVENEKTRSFQNFAFYSIQFFVSIV